MIQILFVAYALILILDISQTSNVNEMMIQEQKILSFAKTCITIKQHYYFQKKSEIPRKMIKFFRKRQY